MGVGGGGAMHAVSGEGGEGGGEWGEGIATSNAVVTTSLTVTLDKSCYSLSQLPMLRFSPSQWRALGCSLGWVMPC